MRQLQPQLLIATTRAMAGMQVVVEHDLGDTRPVVPLVDGRRPSAPRPSWDARFIHECGYWSHYDSSTKSSMWPIPLEFTTPELGLFGQRHDVLYDEPAPGDILLMHCPMWDAFVHSGVVVDVLTTIKHKGEKPMFDLYAIEGDVDKQGRLHGGRSLPVRRRLSPSRGDRFLRWAELDRESMRRERTGRWCT